MPVMKKTYFTILVINVFLMLSCKKDETNTPTEILAKINFIFKFDSTQVRLNNIGVPATVATGHAAQSPRFNSMSAHYLELTPDAFTPLGKGAVLYKAPETSIGGNTAIDFSQAKFAGNNQVFLSIPLKTLSIGQYSWLRVSLAYQNYNVYVNASGQKLDATIASFIGFRTYINSFKVKDSTLSVNGNRDQGYWAFEGAVSGYGFVTSGQAPAGATTVPNPLFNSSPIPAGSCVVTGQFINPLIITGKETGDINIVVSLSTNKSFEWIDNDHNGSYDPLNGDAVTDMGIRGMIPYRQ